MTEQSAPRIRVDSSGIAKRRGARWRGLVVDVVQYTGNRPFRYRYRGPHHLLMAVDRAMRIAGQTHLDGVPRSLRRDISGKLTFVPAGHTYSGSFVPGVPPRITCVYLDPATLAVEPALGFNRTHLAPRLFFTNAVLWSTVAKLTALVEHPTPNDRAYAEALGAVLAIELMHLDSGLRVAEPPARGGLAGWQKRLVSDAFDRSFGEAPGRYQLRRRIERAKTLLADPAKSVTDVALACGFGFPGNFSAAFRKMTGVAPSAFRRTFE